MELPYRLYRDDPYWVPPLRIAVKELLDRDKHPFYANAEAEFFLARAGWRSGRPHRRHHRPGHNRFHEEKRRLFRLLRMRRRPQRWRDALLAQRAAMGRRTRRQVSARPGEPVH